MTSPHLSISYIPLKVNLIPFNASCAEERYKEPPETALRDFRLIVSSYGHLTTIRQHHGR